MRSLHRLGVLAASILTFTFVGEVQAQEVPITLRQEMPYAEARQMLLDAGWQATHHPPVREGEGVLSYLINDLGCHEVEDCSGTGLGLCLFEFTDAYGRRLSVSTANNDPRSGGPTLYEWWIEQDHKR